MTHFLEMESIRPLSENAVLNVLLFVFVACRRNYFRSSRNPPQRSKDQGSNTQQHTNRTNTTSTFGLTNDHTSTSSPERHHRSSISKPWAHRKQRRPRYENAPSIYQHSSVYLMISLWSTGNKVSGNWVTTKSSRANLLLRSTIVHLYDAPGESRVDTRF